MRKCYNEQEVLSVVCKGGVAHGAPGGGRGLPCFKAASQGASSPSDAVKLESSAHETITLREKCSHVAAALCLGGSITGVDVRLLDGAT